jgi:hypothetical protein
MTMADSIRPPGSRAWRGRQAPPGGPQQARSRQRLALIVAAVMLVLGGALAAFILYPRGLPQPHFLPIGLSEYRDERLPPSRWTAQDCTALQGLPWISHNAFTSQERVLLVQELKSLGRGQPADQPLVVYLCARAVVGADGAVAVLPGDARLDEPATWLPLGEVLQYLRDCPVKHKLLLLDLAQPFVDPRAGVLTNDVPERLQPEVKAAVDLDSTLWVLCSCSPGQVSLASEDLGHSVFVHYLTQGLQGRADGCLPGEKPDTRVSARELAAFVTDRVDRWAWHNRRLRQTPVFLGSGGDYPLTVAGAVAEPEGGLEVGYPAWLTEGWRLRERWQQDRGTRTAPATYRELEQALLRAEQRWRGGENTSDVEAALKTRLSRIERQRNAEGGVADRPEPASLAEEVVRGRQPPERDVRQDLRELKRLAEKQVSATTPGPGEKPAEKPAEKPGEKPEEKAFLAPFEGKPFELAWAVFQAALADRNPRPDHLRYWHGLLAAQKEPPTRYAEIAYLGRLGGLSTEKGGEVPAAVVADALQATAEAQKALAAGAAASPRVSALYRETAERKKEGDGLLFGPAAARAKAAEPLKEALRGLLGVNEFLQAVGASEAALDEALDVLPGYAWYLEEEDRREPRWQEAVRAALALREVLAVPPEGRPNPAVLRRLREGTEALRDSLNELGRPAQPDQLSELIRQSRKAGGADARKMGALLRLPVVPAAERGKLYAAWRDLTARLLQADLPEAPPAPDPVRAVREEQERGLLRARVWIALLKLNGVADAAGLEAVLEKARRSPDDRAAWRKLCQELQTRWKGQETK